MNNNDLFELYIKIKDTPPEHQKVLLNMWKSYTGCEYPRIKNQKGKEKHFLDAYKPQKETKKETNSLDNLINSKRNEYDLVSKVMYEKSYTDIPDPFRKRRK